MQNERRDGEESSVEGRRAAQSRDEAGAGGAGRTGARAEGVLTLVCFKCGTEYHFADSRPPAEMTCEKCGNGVFRDFFTAQDDEAAQDFIDTTARDLDPDDAEGETMPSDVIDLNRD
jgi:hypothetical protein